MQNLEPQVKEYYNAKKFKQGDLLRALRAAGAAVGYDLTALGSYACYPPQYIEETASVQQLESIQRLGRSLQKAGKSAQRVGFTYSDGFVEVGFGNARPFLCILASSEQVARQLQVLIENELDLEPKQSTCVRCGRPVVGPEAIRRKRLRKETQRYWFGNTLHREYIENQIPYLMCRHCRLFSNIQVLSAVLWLLLSISIAIVLDTIFAAPQTFWELLVYSFSALGILLLLILLVLIIVERRMGIKDKGINIPLVDEMKADGWFEI